jgi:hypothetical protein
MAMQLHTANQTFLPSDKLRPFVKSLMITQKEKASEMIILPDTGVIINFQYGGKASYIDNGNLKSLKST